MALCGQITVDTPGTAVQGRSTPRNGLVWIYKADPNNTGDVYIGNNGSNDVSSTDGFVLAAGDSVMLESDPHEVWVDAAVASDKVAYIRYK